MKRYLLIAFYLIQFCSLSVAQVMSINGVPMTDAGGAPSNCTAGSYKRISSAVSGNCIILTNNSFQNGAIWACTAINLNESFKMSCQANFGSFSSGGDGIAFLLQTEGVPQVIGAQAGAIGYAQGNGIGCQGGTCPITPSIAVEFDTWDNTVDGLNDIACDHSSMQTNGVMTAGNTLVGPACLKPGGVDVTDGVNHDICVLWDVALLRYRVYFDGVLILTYNGDIRTNFVNPASVYWGFTSGSGGAAQVQSVCSVSMLTNVSSPSCICTPPIASYSPSPVNICSGGLTGITLNSSQPSTTYSWLAVNNLSVNGESTTAQTGSTINETLINTTNVNQTVTYTVTPTTTCAGASISVPVTIYPAPSITNSPTSSSICSGSTATITPTSSLAGSTYNWTAVGSSPSVSGFTATGSGNISHLLVNTGPSVQTVTYTIAPTGPSPGFCIGAPTNFVVTVIPRPDIIPLANQTACSSYTLPTITGTNLTGTQAYWTGANGTGTSYPAGTVITTPGVNTLYTYNQTGTTPNCFDQETFTVTINSSPDITPLANQTACNSYTLPAITGTNLTGTQAYWTGANGTGTSYPAGTAITTPGVNTLYIYNQTGTTPNCFDQETFTLTIENPVVFSLVPTDPTVCNGTDGLILISGLNAGTNYDVTYSDGTTTTGPTTTGSNGAGEITLGSLSAGSYTVTLSITGESCPGVSLSATLNNSVAPVLDPITNYSACDMGYALPTISGSSLSGNQAYYDLPGGPSGGGNVILAGTTYSAPTSITLYVYDENGVCSDQEMFSINIYNSPDITPLTDQTVCNSFTFPAITGSNLTGSELYWTGANGTGTSYAAGTTISTPGVSTLYIYNQTGTSPNCFDEKTFTVTISLFDDPSFSLTDHCNGDPNSATITGAQGGTFTFNPAPTDGALLNSTTGEITSATDGGVYSIGYTTSGACPSTELQVVTVHGTPTAPIVSQDETFCETGNLVNMSATGGSGTFNWYSDFGLNSILGTGPSLAPSNTLGTTIYYVTESSNGCEGQSSSVTITIEECEIIVPTAFTPNGDLANDTWEILFLDEFYPNNQVFVYNRWGNLIYESVKGDYLSSPWNGQYNGVLLPVASYYYIIELNDQGGDKRSGSVSIILD